MDGTGVKEKIDYLFELYKKKGSLEYGERLSMLMHMMQCALLAKKAGEEEEIILAAFLHDVGHFFEGEGAMAGYGSMRHDELGARCLLDLGFPQRMADMVASHVAAKRYLVFAEPAYFAELSEASRVTLGYQGGPMTSLEAQAFERDPLAPVYVKLRRWDDLGKDPEQPVLDEDILYMRELALRYLSSRQSVST